MSTNHDKKLSELYDLKEMYETRLKSANIDKSLKIHYQIMLDSIIYEIKIWEGCTSNKWITCS